jgi:hypothetical protein
MTLGNAGRRRWLRLLASGALGGAAFGRLISEAIAKGDKPLPPAIHHLEGSAKVNGREATVGTPVALGDRVATGAKSRAVVVVGEDAFLLRADTTIEVRGASGVLSELTVATGKVLSVFAKKPVSIKAASASIGIRGTGAYIEMDPDSVYFCLCYGEAQVDGPGGMSRNVKTSHHEMPLFLRDGATMRIEPAGFRDHKDDELIMLESLVGREPPFVKSGTYPANKY